MNSSAVGPVSVPTGDPVVCRGVDAGNVETPGIWMVVDGVPSEEPSAAVTDRVKAEETSCTRQGRAVSPGFTGGANTHRTLALWEELRCVPKALL